MTAEPKKAGFCLVTFVLSVTFVTFIYLPDKTTNPAILVSDGLFACQLRSTLALDPAKVPANNDDIIR